MTGGVLDIHVNCLCHICFCGKKVLQNICADHCGGIMLLVDLLGTGYNFYAYPRGILYLWIPVLHIFQTYASSILYLNWPPVAGAASRLYNTCLCFVPGGRSDHVSYRRGHLPQLEPRLQLYNTNFWIISAGLFIRFCDKG